MKKQKIILEMFFSFYCFLCAFKSRMNEQFESNVVNPSFILLNNTGLISWGGEKNREHLKGQCPENFVLTETVGFKTRPYRYAGTTFNICVLSP